MDVKGLNVYIVELPGGSAGHIVEDVRVAIPVEPNSSTVVGNVTREDRLNTLICFALALRYTELFLSLPHLFLPALVVAQNPSIHVLTLLALLVMNAPYDQSRDGTRRSQGRLCTSGHATGNNFATVEAAPPCKLQLIISLSPNNA